MMGSMMKPLYDYLYRFPAEVLQIRGRCRVRIYERGEGAHTVLLTELANNAGESITTACERIATDLAATKRLNPKTTRWIQHELPHGGKPQTFDELHFVWTGDNAASDPQWQHLNNEQIEAATGNTPSLLSLHIGDSESHTEEED
jgi:hypothetical protein